MSFFEKLKRGLQKTKNAIIKPFSELFKKLRGVDEDLLEELEEILVCADVGAVTSDEILTKLRAEIKANKIKDSVTDSLKTRNDGVKTASFAVLRPTEYIGVLVELAYMINPNDSVMYRKESFPADAAKAIAEGVLNYITQE